jgi:hypothetical protein
LRALTLFGLVLVAGCARAHANQMDRAETLRRALLEHDRAALARDRDLVAAKYARMARTKFAFFRGTAWLWPPEPSRFAIPAASQVAVMGDPHPENVGTFLAGAVRAIEFNDFDLAGYGSFVDDLRRMAVGLWVVADMADLKHKQRARLVEHLVDGYLEELEGLAQGKPPLALRADALSGDLEEVLAPPESEAKELPASSEDEVLARAILAVYPRTLLAERPAAQFRLKALTRRHAGISSFTALRLQAVVEGPTPAAADDWTLEIKESVGPAARIVAIQRQFQERPDVDPLLGWAAVNGREFRVRQLLPGQRRLDAERLAKQVKSPSWAKRDLQDLAHALGRLLARGHALALGRDGKPGRLAIGRAIGGRGEDLRAETVAFAEKHAALNTDDFHLFQHLLATRGPLLGWEGKPTEDSRPSTGQRR